MEKKTLEYYEWDDVEARICELMGIEQKFFRDYHKVVGGEYKDCWHLSISWIGEESVSNGCYVSLPMWRDKIEDYDYHLEEYPWSTPFFEAVIKLREEIGDSPMVHISW